MECAGQTGDGEDPKGTRTRRIKSTTAMVHEASTIGCNVHMYVEFEVLESMKYLLAFVLFNHE